jgi:hypothetical protein
LLISSRCFTRSPRQEHVEPERLGGSEVDR